MPPLTKYDTIAPILDINEIRFGGIDPDIYADSRYKKYWSTKKCTSYERLKTKD